MSRQRRGEGEKFSFATPLAKALPLLLLLLLWQGPALPALAQNPITARVDRDSVAMDEQVVLTVTVSGDFLTIPRPDLSQTQDFVVVSSGQSTQVSIVNGKMTSQGVFIYRLQPLIEGEMTIAPITVNIGGEVYETAPITIEVLPTGSRSTPAAPQPDSNAPTTIEGQDFFVEAEVSDLNPYLGEQIVYTFRLYQAANIFGQPDYRPPAFTDFWSSEILEQPHYNTQAGGREYLVTEILTALFPANLGEITIEPARLVIPGGVFKPDVKLESQPVTVNVRPLPDNAPENFKGAVGQFEIRASLSEAASKINEPLTLRLEIEGVGNIETLTEPNIPEVENWRFFESQADTSVRTNRGQLGGIRSFERLVVPGQAGEQIFPAIEFSYFDPESSTYQTISTEPMPVTISPDDSLQPLPIMPGRDIDGQPVDLVSGDIVPLKPVPYSLRTPQVISTVARVLYWSAWILPLFVMGAALVWKNRQIRLQQDPAYARSLFARRKALKLLADAQANGHDAVSAAGRALLGYLSDKLNRPTSGLTTAALLGVLQEARLPDELIQRVNAVLQQVEIGRYAPIPVGDARALVSETQALIGDLEKAFGK